MSPIPQQIHVLQVVTSLEPGGLENGIVNFSNQLDPTRFKTSIVCLERKGAFAKRLSKDIVIRDLQKPPGFHWSTVRDLATLIDALQPDILHTHNLGPLIYGVLGKLTSTWKPSILHGEHGELGPSDLSKKRLFMRRLAYRACAKIHTVSGGLRNSLIELGLGDEKSITSILNGVDCNRFKPATRFQFATKRQELGIPEHAIVYGIVSRFAAFKGHSRLIAGFERAAAKEGSIYLLVVGDNGDAKTAILEQIESSPYKKQIKWVGYQEQTEKYIQVMDALLIPSDLEGLSNVMLETMACGKTCVTHPACGASEVITDGENGLIRNLSDAEYIHQVLNELSVQPQRLHDLGDTARSFAQESFSLDAMVRSYGDLFEKLARNNTQG